MYMSITQDFKSMTCVADQDNHSLTRLKQYIFFKQESYKLKKKVQARKDKSIRKPNHNIIISFSWRLKSRPDSQQNTHQILQKREIIKDSYINENFEY